MIKSILCSIRIIVVLEDSLIFLIVEERVKATSGLKGEVGVALMRAAFNPSGGPNTLTDMTLLAAERRRLVDQPGDIGIPVGLRAGDGMTAVIAGHVVLVLGGRGQPGAGRPRRGGLGGRPACHPGSAFFRTGADLVARMI